MKQHLLKLSPLIILALGVPFWALATDYTGGDFIIPDPVIDSLGGTASSSNFSQTQSGFQAAPGRSTSSNFTLLSGFQYFDGFTPRSQNWRWYDDQNNETPAAALAAENIAPIDIEDQNIIKLRISVGELAGIASPNQKFKVQFSTSPTFTSVTDAVEQGGCTVSSVWCYADGVDADGDTVQNKVLSDADACSGGSGNGCGTHNESGTTSSTFDHKRGAVVEYEFTVKPAGATPNMTYYFRLYDVTNGAVVATCTGESFPSLSTAGANLTFTVSGLASGTSTGGITTDVATATTSVAFGALPVNTSIKGAQRLTVTTNAPEGYTVYVYQTQNFLSGLGSQLLPVSGTNASPTAWSSGCSPGAASCYGYHTGDAVLSGGSTRFAADDTYAQLESAAREIIFNAGPVMSESTDVVYRTEISPLQPPGSYNSSVGYIAVPVF